jgi:hypothetical protein
VAKDCTTQLPELPEIVAVAVVVLAEDRVILAELAELA